MSHFTLGVVNVGGGECRGGECRTIVCYDINDMSTTKWAEWHSFFACFAQKLAAARKKLAPTGRHSRHIFATLHIRTPRGQKNEKC